MLDKINEAKKFINDLTSNKKIHTVIILGSGMSGFEKNYDIIHQVSYSDIPNFLQPSIEGHSGTLSIVEIEEKYTAILSKDLKITAKSPDGVIEGIETTND